MSTVYQREGEPPGYRPMSRSRAALAGAVAAIAALGVSELLAGLLNDVPSLILGVAELFVDETPGGIVRWSIDLFGTSQKTLLVVGIVVASRRARGALWSADAALVRHRCCGLRRASASSAEGQRPAVSQRDWLRVGRSRDQLDRRGDRRARGSSRDPWRRHRRTRRCASSSQSACRIAVASRGRREPLRPWGVVAGAVGRQLRQNRNVEGARAEVATRLDAAAPSIPANVETFDTAVDDITPLVTPNADFYRIDTSSSLRRSTRVAGRCASKEWSTRRSS